ncbi:hypothetical protein F4805DRAFT_431329 [Annulohypoxylon moriforme]|nr:hypothetical protein F4805DRAFT_431329 [Annulohypoxylon moriforme]
MVNGNGNLGIPPSMLILSTSVVLMLAATSGNVVEMIAVTSLIPPVATGPPITMTPGMGSCSNRSDRQKSLETVLCY